MRWTVLTEEVGQAVQVGYTCDSATPNASDVQHPVGIECIRGYETYVRRCAFCRQKDERLPYVGVRLLPLEYSTQSRDLIACD